MKNKTVIAVLIILGIILAVLIGIYFIRQNKSLTNPSENIMQQNQNSVPVNSAPENSATNQMPALNEEGTTSSAGTNKQTNTEQPQSKLVTDDFDVNLPAGWRQTAPAIGASAMAVNVNESINDPAAQKINFKSYFAVSYDVLQGKSMNEYVQIVKSGLQQSIANVVFTKEQNMTINDKSAHAIEAELTQQGVNFKILMVVVKGQGDDVWVMSFNTTKSSWDGYKETFYGVANSFNLKK
jgi:hypothetical protein